MAQVVLDASVRLTPDSALPLFRVPALLKVPHLVHAITRRRFPGSAGEFDLKRGDAASRRAEFARQLGVAPERTVWLDPDETGPVQFVTDEDAGRGASDWETRIRHSSGIVTDAFNLFLCALYNDNAVVLLFDPRWYGVGLVNLPPSPSAAEALVEAVALLCERTGAAATELTALIGPSVGPCCRTFPDPALAGARGKSNLWDRARGELMKAGLRRDLILNPRTCTACADTEFFSRDVDGPDGGAGALVIGVLDDCALRAQLSARRASEKVHRPAVVRSDAPSLTEEEKRLNALVRCPYGQNKVYIRSVFDGQSVATSKPQIALRCAVMREIGHAIGGYNIVTLEHIETICCADFKLCETYRELAKRQKR